MGVMVSRVGLAAELQNDVLVFVADTTVTHQQLLANLSNRIGEHALANGGCATSTVGDAPTPMPPGLRPSCSFHLKAPASPTIATPSSTSGADRLSTNGLSESPSQVLWRRLISRHSAPGWKPPQRHVLLCGGIIRMSGCATQIYQHNLEKVHIVALCNVPPSETPAFQLWLSRAAPLLSCPVDMLTLIHGSEMEVSATSFLLPRSTSPHSAPSHPNPPSNPPIDPLSLYTRLPGGRPQVCGRELRPLRRHLRAASRRDDDQRRV